jgi:hypothetical protein
MSNTNEGRCQAANRATCWKHGSGLGFDANRKIREDMKNNVRPQGTRFELKKLDCEEIAQHIMLQVENYPHIDAEKVKHAILLASDLHKTDTRSNRGDAEKTPYIEHPLRNTLRLMRLGCTDETVIIGSLLHDTVEDHPFEMAEKVGVKTEDEQEARDASYAYLEKKYSKEVSDMVHGMSNPIIENKYMPAAEKNIIYRDHVHEAIENPHVFLAKVSDFIDNALSLHHTESSMSSISLYKKSTKYLLVCDVLSGRLLAGMGKKDIPLSDESLGKIYAQLVGGKKRLIAMQKKHAPQLQTA